MTDFYRVLQRLFSTPSPRCYTLDAVDYFLEYSRLDQHHTPGF